MAHIPFTDRELRYAWRSLYQASAQHPRSNPHRLLLLYAIECGLKALWLKRAGRTLFEATDIGQTGHDLKKIICYLHWNLSLPDRFHLPDVLDARRNPVARRHNALENLHQAWRYGGQLEAPDDDAKLETELEKIHLQITKELRS